MSALKLDRMKMLARWQAAKISTARQADMHRLAQKVLGFKEQYYDPVEQKTKVPWYAVAAIDMRESSFRHDRYLGNGQLLTQRTTIVPKGRGPFKSWHEGAIDALTLTRFPHLGEGQHWDIVTTLIKLENYNGLGYASRGLPSPYLWGATTVQRPGKYVADGHFNPTAWDYQPGCAALLLALKEWHGVDLREA